MHLTFAIGDIHGRADLLARLLDAIADHATATESDPRVIFLGDLINKGPDSRGVLALVRETLEKWPGSRLILGNHEEFFLDTLNGDERSNAARALWMSKGGTQMLESYGLSPELTNAEIAATFSNEFAEDLSLLRSADPYIVDGRMIYAHAGIDPEVSVEAQDPHRTRWIRTPFFDHPAPLPYWVVHGHTVTQGNLPYVSHNRIGIDTGAAAVGRLTALVVPANQKDLRFLSTVPGSDPIEVLLSEPFDRPPFDA